MRARATITLILALAAGLAAGCGGDDEGGEPIPQQAAADLQSRLDEVERRMEAGGGACADIQNDTLPAIESTIDSLPDDVDPEVRDALVQSFQRLFDLVQEQCDEQKGQEQEEPAPVETEPTLPPADEEDDEDEGDEEEEAPPTTETAPTETEPPAEVPPEEGSSGGSGQGGSGTAGQGGGTAGQGDGGGALVPGDTVP